jgi:hypothetical protein
MAAILSAVVARGVEFVEVPLERVMAQSEDLGLMFEWFYRDGYSADIPAQRREYPEVGWQTFETWARAHART